MFHRTKTSNPKKKAIIEARNEILLNKNPSKAINDLKKLLHNIDSDNEIFFKRTLALGYFENNDFKKAIDLYKELDEKYQVGYCELLLGNPDKAREIWDKAHDSPAIHWGKAVLNLLNLKLPEQAPTYLQVRNHLECDIGCFIKANKLQYAENLIKCEEFLASINLETYKFIGKALIYNGYPDLGVKFILKSQSIVPQDPEIYYCLAQYSYILKAYQECQGMLNQCLNLNSEFYPAQKMLETVKLKLNK